MRFGSADQAARAYRRLVERLYSTSGLDFLDRTLVCVSCGGGPMTTIGGGFYRKRDGTWDRMDTREVCASCRMPWEGRLEVGVRGVISTYHGSRTFAPYIKISGSRGSARPESRREEDIGLLAHLRPIFVHRPRRMTQREWEFHLVAWFALLESTLAGVVLAGEKELPGMALPWTEGHVRGAVERARKIVTDRLRRARLLEGGYDRHGGGWTRGWRSHASVRSLRRAGRDAGVPSPALS